MRNEFTASQQYTAIAVHFDAADLPQLTKHFYAQALGEQFMQWFLKEQVEEVALMTTLVRIA
jgi:ferritin